MPATSEMYVVQGNFGILAIHYGTCGAGAHAFDEYVVLEDLVTTTKVLTLLVLDWCSLA